MTEEVSRVKGLKLVRAKMIQSYLQQIQWKNKNKNALLAVKVQRNVPTMRQASTYHFLPAGSSRASLKKKTLWKIIASEHFWKQTYKKKHTLFQIC